MYKIVRCATCHRPQITTANTRVNCKFCGKSFRALSEKEFGRYEEARAYLYSITS